MPIIKLESLRYETGVLSTKWQLRRNMKISQNGKLPKMLEYAAFWLRVDVGSFHLQSRSANLVMAF
jgi:hypothetical protein